MPEVLRVLQRDVEMLVNRLFRHAKRSIYEKSTDGWRRELSCSLAYRAFILLK